ncbi:PEP-utilizing enzyme [Ornithinimicrobium sp. W1679]|uniref:PEP-utilizing enzyme n=1 Tax=Ornithinimicrobium sp. W1679 TaxID=3418770 RepID=UPI003CF4EA17
MGPRHDQAPEQLVGRGASQGTAMGRAVVVRGANDFPKVQIGDILVCEVTAPSWTPLFEIAAGIVTERGGVLSHAAIVARELGLPAIVGVEGLVGTIVDGQVLTIDGTTGVVLL